MIPTPHQDRAYWLVIVLDVAAFALVIGSGVLLLGGTDPTPLLGIFAGIALAFASPHITAAVVRRRRDHR